MVQPVECLVAPLALGPAAVGVHPGVPLQLVVSEHSEVLLSTLTTKVIQLPITKVVNQISKYSENVPALLLGLLKRCVNVNR